MDSGMIGKIDKARRYAEQRERFHVQALTVTFEGDNNPHTIHLQGGTWRCDCAFFQTHNVCSHTMALEKILTGLKGFPEPSSV